MNELIVASIFPPDVGGPATYAFQEFKRGTDVVILGKGKWRYINLFFDLLKADNDSFFAMDAICSGIPAFLVSILTGKSFMLRIGGDYAWEHHRLNGGTKSFNEYQYYFQWSWRSIAQRFIVRHAELVIVPGNYMASIVRNWGATNILIEPNESSIIEPKESREELRRELGLNDKQTIFLVVGRDVPWKNRKILPQKAAKLFQSGYRIVYLTNKPKEELAKWYKAADYLLLPSEWEGSSHVIREALAFNLPCVVSDIPGNREIEDERITYIPWDNGLRWRNNILEKSV